MGAGRAYEIALHGGSGEPRRLSRSEHHGLAGMRPSQREFVVAPGGRYLAFREAKSNDLIVRSRSGRTWRVDNVYNYDYRFSPDGDAIAYFRTGGKQASPNYLGVLDLETGGREDLAKFAGPRWLEWTSEGIVALNATGGTTNLHLVTRDGEERRLVTGDGITRFTAASRGDEVVYFNRQGAYVIDVTEAAPAEKKIWEPESYPYVINAELSPDGRTLAFAAGRSLHVLRAGGGRTRFAFEGTVHSIWFSRDGSTLLFGASDGAVAVDVESRRQRRFTPKSGRIKSLRFRRGGRGAVLAAGGQVFYWDPRTGDRKVAHRVDDGHRLEGADSFGGELVVWSSRRIDDQPKLQPQKKKRAPRKRVRQQAAMPRLER